MAESVYSDETIIFENMTVEIRMRSSMNRLKQKFLEKYSETDQSLLQNVDPRKVCAELTMINSLKEDLLLEGIIKNEEDIDKFALDSLSKDIEDMKNEIDDTKRYIEEENEAINRMQDGINRLTTLKLHKNRPYQDIDLVIQEINKKFKEFKNYLNDLLEELYPDKSEEIKNILMDLVQVTTNNTDIYPYIKIKEEYDEDCIHHLLTADIIQTHPEFLDYIKLYGLLV